MIPDPVMWTQQTLFGTMKCQNRSNRLSALYMFLYGQERVGVAPGIKLDIKNPQAAPSGLPCRILFFEIIL